MEERYQKLIQDCAEKDFKDVKNEKALLIFIAEKGTLEMMEIYVKYHKIEGFPLQQPDLGLRLIPLAVQQENNPLVNYLICHLEMEFRLRLFKWASVLRNKKIVESLQPFLPLQYQTIKIDNPFFFQVTNFMEEILFQNDGFYPFYGILMGIVKNFDVETLANCRVVSRNFKNFIDESAILWESRYEDLKVSFTLLINRVSVRLASAAQLIRSAFT